MINNGSLNITENVVLAPLTTLGVGGAARFFAEARSEHDIIDALDFAGNRGLELFVLGEGSNIVVSDSGFDGLVLKVSIPGIEREQAEEAGASHPGLVIFSVGSGEKWDDFVAHCVKNDLCGVECLSGIPGLVGAVPVQNVGAYGQEVGETIISVRAIDRESGQSRVFENKDCDFAYRSSIFNASFRDRFIITSVSFGMKRNGVPNIGYQDLRERFGSNTPDLAEVRRLVLQVRASKSMLIDPADANSRSVGSFFKNPVIDLEQLAAIEESSGGLHIPNFPVESGRVKVPAAWLIENAGFYKGYVKGNVGISRNHSLAIINRGGAKAAEVLLLKRAIQDAVRAKFGVSLVPEPTFVGFSEQVS